MKKMIISAILLAAASFGSTAATIEATFEREVGAVCYVKQGSDELQGTLALKGESAREVSAEVVSNTDDIILEYTKLTVNSGDFQKGDVTFKINGNTADLGDEVTVPSGFVGLSMKLQALDFSDFKAGERLSATAVLEVECEDENSQPEDDCDDDDFDPASGMWCPDYFEPDTDAGE